MTTPIFDLPDVGVERISFDLIVPQRVSRMAGRRTEARLSGTPYWTASYALVAWPDRKLGQVEAFIRKVLSRGGVFRAYDAQRPRPLEFGSVPLTWTPDLISISGGGRAVGISGVANNAQFREGDYVAFRQSDLVVSLHSIAADVQANGSGVVALTLDPLLDTQNFTTAAMPIFEQPYCLMQPFDWSSQKAANSRNPSFSAQEVFFYES